MAESPAAPRAEAGRVPVAGCVVAAVAFAAYASTLLPGVDLGDTGGFQAAVLWPETSARQAYPLYYTLARPFVAFLAPANPARGLNLFSAVAAAGAAGALAAVVAGVTRSAAGGVAAGLLLAFSYTFWTQAVIAEVYALHLALVALCLLALATYARRPGTTRLALFFAVYAAAFGNHLSMILLLAPFAVFLFMTAERPRDLLRPRIVLLALAIAVAGALQYLPNFLAVWTSVDAPWPWAQRVAAFWFDVTKADWRGTMVLGLQRDLFGERLAMVAFDARQQFGVAGLAVAAAGAGALWRRHRPWAVLILLAYGVNTLFAFTYNVGDPHVFFLPGHLFTAFAAGAAVAWAVHAAGPRRLTATVLATAAVGYAAWRAYDTWPAASRRGDRRAEQAIARLTMGLDERDALLVTHLNWQVENALLYETRYRLRHVAWVRLPDVFLHLPLLVADNHAAGRDVVLTSAAIPQVIGAFGALFPVAPDTVPPAPSLAMMGARIPAGAPYVLALLPPPADETLDAEVLDATIRRLAGGRRVGRTGAAYEVIVGRAGERPLAHVSAARPFRQSFRIPEGLLDIRIDGWASLETFRRGGFGHVTLNRRRLMTIERGASLIWVDEERQPAPFYAAGLYAPTPRFRIPAAGVPGLALLH